MNSEEILKQWTHAVSLIENSVEIRSKRCGGVPCLKGTRITISQIFAQIAEGDSIDVLAEEFDIDKSALVSLLNGLSLAVNQKMSD